MKKNKFFNFGIIMGLALLMPSPVIAASEAPNSAISGTANGGGSNYAFQATPIDSTHSVTRPEGSETATITSSSSDADVAGVKATGKSADGVGVKDIPTALTLVQVPNFDFGSHIIDPKDFNTTTGTNYNLYKDANKQNDRSVHITNSFGLGPNITTPIFGWSLFASATQFKNGSNALNAVKSINMKPTISATSLVQQSGGAQYNSNAMAVSMYNSDGTMNSNGQGSISVGNTTRQKVAGAVMPSTYNRLGGDSIDIYLDFLGSNTANIHLDSPVDASNIGTYTSTITWQLQSGFGNSANVAA